MRTRRGFLYGTAIIAAAAPPLIWLLSRLPAVSDGPVTVSVALAATPAAAAKVPQSEWLDLAQRDPLELVHRARQRCAREVKDYRCVLVKQELLDEGLSAVQEIEVRYRRAPRSIYMLWQKNADETKRALFKDEPGYVDADGNQLARVEPAGSVVRLFVKDILMPIHGERARKVSRRSIDECSFEATLELMERFSAQAQKSGVLDLRYTGPGEVDGRPTLVFVRYLPYTEGSAYPDAKLVLHLDQEWLLPLAVESYADHDGTALLGRYVFSKVQLNPGLGDKDFEF